MKRVQLIAFLKNGFLVLYRGCLWLGLVFLFITSPLWQEMVWQWELRKRPLLADGSHIIYDTLAAPDRFSERIKLRERSADFPFTILKSDLGTEKRYTTIDSLGRENWTKTEAELKTGPDSLWRLIRSAEQFAGRRQQAEIDSVLRYNPEAYIVKRRVRYSVWEPSFMSGVTLQMSSGMGPVPAQYNPRKVWEFNGTPSWEYVLEAAPMIKIKREPELYNKDYYLIFLYRTWQQYKAIPIGAHVLGRLPFLLAWLALLIGIYQFKRLFDDLYEARYFDRQQSKRIRWVGWIMLGYFVSHLILINLQNLYVRKYLVGKGFHTYDGFVPRFPDNWSLLLTGLVLLVLAHVFEYGQQLKQEQDLTI